jgi:hypothetical protein
MTRPAQRAFLKTILRNESGTRRALSIGIAAVLLLPQSAHGLTSFPTADIELRAAAAASDPGNGAWSVELRKADAGAITARVDGRGPVVRVYTHWSRSTSWTIEGTGTLAKLRPGSVPREVLADAGSRRASWVLVDREGDSYLLQDEAVRTDPGLRPDRFALWLLEGGSVRRSSAGSYVGTRQPTTLPYALDRFYFDDHETPIEVTVSVSAGKVTGYRIYQRAIYGDERILTVTTTTPRRSLVEPGSSSFVTLSSLEAAVERAASVERLWKPVTTDTTIYDLGRIASLFGPRPDRIPVPTVAPTLTGAVVIPGVRAQTSRLSGARCFNLPTVRPQPRPCTAADKALLTPKFAPYAEWLTYLATNQSLTEEQVMWGLHSMNHSLWLYSGLRFEPEELAAWDWFTLDVFTRARPDRSGTVSV